MLYGSVADQVLHHATTPVLMVPSVIEHAWPTDRPLSLMVPLDGSALSETALPAAELFAEAFESRLTLLSVVEPPGYPLYGDGYAYVPFDEDAERERANQYLKQRVTELRDRGRDADASVAVGLPPALIAAIAREQDIDVIVMATHGSSGLTGCSSEASRHPPCSRRPCRCCLPGRSRPRSSQRCPPTRLRILLSTPRPTRCRPGL